VSSNQNLFALYIEVDFYFTNSISGEDSYPSRRGYVHDINSIENFAAPKKLEIINVEYPL
jgi:hypothetical protein